MTINNKAIILLKFNKNHVSRYIDEEDVKKDLIRLEQESYCKKCESIEGIKVYEWINESSYVNSDDSKGNFILIFSLFGTLVSANHLA